MVGDPSSQGYGRRLLTKGSSWLRLSQGSTHGVASEEGFLAEAMVEMLAAILLRKGRCACNCVRKECTIADIAQIVCGKLSQVCTNFKDDFG